MTESLISHELEVPRKIATPRKSLPHFGWVVLLLLVTTVGLTSLDANRPTRADASDAPSFAYTALGDSLTVKAGYVDRYTDYVGTDMGVPVALTNLGLVGYTSGGLSYRLANDQTFRDSVNDANLITVMIGINDFGLASWAYEHGTCGGTDNQDCIRNTETSFGDNFTEILSQIRAINGTRNAVILVADIYNPAIQKQTENGTLGIYVPFVDQINALIHSISSANGISVADVYHSFNGADGMEDANAKGYLVPDGHANDQGHLEIAGQFRKLNNVLLDGDADGDGLTNGAERYYGTNPLLADTDGDGLTDGAEIKTYRTDPLVGDTDGDGCRDAWELGPDPRHGGQRDPSNPWDYFNPMHDGHIRLEDVLAVVDQYHKDSGNPAYNVDTDRTVVGPNEWNTGAPNGQQRVDDILAEVHQFHHDCG